MSADQADARYLGDDPGKILGEAAERSRAEAADAPREPEPQVWPYDVLIADRAPDKDWLRTPMRRLGTSALDAARSAWRWIEENESPREREALDRWLFFVSSWPTGSPERFKLSDLLEADTADE